MCERFHCLPSALLAEDAELLSWLRLVDYAGVSTYDNGQ
jgi:hypothetical protein